MTAPSAISTHINLSTHRLPLYLAAGTASIGLILCFNSARNSLKHHAPQPIPSPRKTVLPHLSKAEIGELPYPPNALPGVRDVDSPYGSIRVYEWGPEDGRKVLLIHGISTPSIALGSLAHRLVEKGCRVMLFDLFGRGYSSAPPPNNFDYSSTLYTTQIHLVLASSSLPWTTTGFTLIGYSLGGAIGADFTSYFPKLINSLILIAPGGLIRTKHITWKSRLLYSTGGIIPESWIERLVAKRLWTGPEEARTIEPEPDQESKEKANSGSSGGGLKSTAVYLSSNTNLLPGNPNSTVGKVVDWQILHHKGLVPAFISSIRHAPIHEQQERWKIIGQRLYWQAQFRANAIPAFDGAADVVEREGLEQNKVLLVLGETDPIIIAEEVAEDARNALGENFVDVKIVHGTGHEVPVQRSKEVAEIIEAFWNNR